MSAFFSHQPSQIQAISAEQLQDLRQFFLAATPFNQQRFDRIAFIVENRILTAEQELELVNAVKQQHPVMKSQLSHVEKLEHLKKFSESYRLEPKNWMRSAIIKLLEDWIKCNKPELDTALRDEIYGDWQKPAPTMRT